MYDILLLEFFKYFHYLAFSETKNEATHITRAHNVYYSQPQKSKQRRLISWLYGNIYSGLEMFCFCDHIKVRRYYSILCVIYSHGSL